MKTFLLHPLMRRRPNGQYQWSILDAITDQVLRMGKAWNREDARKQQRKSMEELKGK